MSHRPFCLLLFHPYVLTRHSKVHFDETLAETGADVNYKGAFDPTHPDA